MGIKYSSYIVGNKNYTVSYSPEEEQILIEHFGEQIIEKIYVTNSGESQTKEKV